MNEDVKWMVVWSYQGDNGEIPAYYSDESYAKDAFEALKRTERTVTLWAQKITRVTITTTEDLDW